MSVRKLRILIILVVVIAVVGRAAGYVVKKRVAAANKPTVVRVEEAQPGELMEFVSAPARSSPRARSRSAPRSRAASRSCRSRWATGSPRAIRTPIRPFRRRCSCSSTPRTWRASCSGPRPAGPPRPPRSSRKRPGSPARRPIFWAPAATLEQAKTRLERQKKLLATKDISQSEFDQAQLKLDELQAQYEAAKLGLERRS